MCSGFWFKTTPMYSTHWRWKFLLPLCIAVISECCSPNIEEKPIASPTCGRVRYLQQHLMEQDPDEDYTEYGDWINRPSSESQYWPWLVVIGRRLSSPVKRHRKRNMYWCCHGTLITPAHVLTDFRCLQELLETGVKNRKKKKSVWKATRLRVRAGVTVFYQQRKVGAIHLPPSSTNVSVDETIRKHNRKDRLTLITLEEPLRLRRGVGVVCLPTVKHLAVEVEGTSAIVTGWGRSDSRINTHHADVIMICTRNCELILRDCIANFDSYYPGGFDGQLLCAHFTIGSDSSVCYGKPGGPLLVKEKSCHTLDGSCETRVVMIGVVNESICNG